MSDNIFKDNARPSYTTSDEGDTSLIVSNNVSDNDSALSLGREFVETAEKQGLNCSREIVTNSQTGNQTVTYVMIAPTGDLNASITQKLQDGAITPITGLTADDDVHYAYKQGDMTAILGCKPPIM